MKRQEMEKFCSGFPKLINSPYLTALQDYLIEKDTKWETQDKIQNERPKDKIQNERPKRKYKMRDPKQNTKWQTENKLQNDKPQIKW